MVCATRRSSSPRAVGRRWGWDEEAEGVVWVECEAGGTRQVQCGLRLNRRRLGGVNSQPLLRDEYTSHWPTNLAVSKVTYASRSLSRADMQARACVRLRAHAFVVY